MSYKIKPSLDNVLNGKDYKKLQINKKQKKEIDKVIDFLGSDKNINEEILKRQGVIKIIPRMINAGVEDLFLRRILRKYKYVKNKVTLYGMVLLYGRQGYNYGKEYCDRQSYTNSYEYKKEKYGGTEDDFKNYNNSRAVTKENLIKKHGKDKGLKIGSNYRDRQSYTNSLEYYYEKYGIEDGKEEWLKLNKKKSLCLSNFIKKYGEKEGKEKGLDIFDKKNRNFYSKISQEVFGRIYSELNGTEKLNSYFATLNKEYFLYDNLGKKIYFYDYIIKNKNICIEFNGDLGHCNPKIYSPDDSPYYISNITAKEVGKKDKIKFDFLKSMGYNLIIVGEKDYIENKKEIIDKCIRWIYEK